MSPVRVLRGFTLGGIGGVLGWFLIEFLPPPFPSPPFRPGAFEAPGAIIPSITPTDSGLQGIILGLCIGGMLGISEGVAEGTASRFRRSLFAFLGLGGLGGFLGLYFGQILYGILGGDGRVPGNVGEFFQQIIARSVGWMLIGLLLGAVFGAPNLSARRAWNGAMGGAMGGLLGGFFFQTLTSAGIFQGVQGRLVGFAMLGAAIGFFISLIAEALKRVWVKVLTGRNEGREHILDTAVAYVGRDELAEIPVFLDPSLPRRVASFRANGGRYSLVPEPNAPPILVNGQPAASGQVLRDGDAIQFGRVTLAYFEKATATGRARPVDSVPLAEFGQHAVLSGTAPIPTASNVCEFCGQQRDPLTGACACSVPADAAMPGGAYPPPGMAPGMGPGMAPAYAPAPAPDFGGGYATAAPGYAATVMDPGLATAGGPRLVVTAGPYAGQVFPVAGDDIYIGRDPSQSIPLTNDSTTSRRHARLAYVNGAWTLYDAGSSNGTWVNGVRIQEQPLFPGDVVRLGATEFRIEG